MNMEILIMPSYEKTKEATTVDNFDDDNEEGVLYQQGHDGYQLTVNDGDTFEIDEGYIGRLMSRENYYFGFQDPEDEELHGQDPIEDDIEEGEYRLEGNRIYKLNE
jgi:hypothetical protein